MDTYLEYIQDIDLYTFGQHLLVLIDTSDPCFIALVLSVLIFIGSKMAAPFPNLRSWGLRIAAGTFLAYFGYVYFTEGAISSSEISRVGLRAFITAGMVLVPLWIVLPILLFVVGRLRLAIAAFLLYFSYAWITAGEMNSEMLPYVAMRGGIAAGLALIVAWIFQPITDFITTTLQTKKQELQERLQGNSSSQSPSQLPAPKQSFPSYTTTEALMSSSKQDPASADQLREELKELLEVRKVNQRHEANLQADKHRRRLKARLKAELCYTLHESTIGPALPRHMFEEFLEKYLGDQNHPEDVEENARELESIIFQYASNANPMMVHPINLSDLTQWYMDEQKRIEGLETDTSNKKSQLAGLTRRYTQLATQIIEGENN